MFIEPKMTHWMAALRKSIRTFAFENRLESSHTRMGNKTFQIKSIAIATIISNVSKSGR